MMKELIKSAENDYAVADILYKNKQYAGCITYLQWSSEKLLKAFYIQETGEQLTSHIITGKLFKLSRKIPNSVKKSKVITIANLHKHFETIGTSSHYPISFDTGEVIIPHEYYDKDDAVLAFKIYMKIKKIVGGMIQ